MNVGSASNPTNEIFPPCLCLAAPAAYQQWKIHSGKDALHVTKTVEKILGSAFGQAAVAPAY
jgi:hypothetical protein